MADKTMKFGVGVIGATGYIGTPYRDEIRQSPQDATIVALCARRQDRLQTAGREDGAALATTNWREVVEHPDVNLVLVATPDALHLAPALAAAAAGKHLICEKPLGANAREAFRIWNAYRDKPLCHFVPFWTRYVPVFERARQIYRSGTLGEVKAVVYRWHNPRPEAMPFTWRDDAALSAAGSIADVGSHAYDTLRWILGQDATLVLAHGGVITPPRPDLGTINLGEAIAWGESRQIGDSQMKKRSMSFDYAAIAFEMDAGTVATLTLSHATYLRKGLAPELELHGTNASLAVDRINGKITLARPGLDAELLETVRDAGFGNRFGKYVFPALRAEMAGAACEHPNLRDGWRAQLFTDAAAQSARTGTWVELAEIERSCQTE